MNFQGESTLRIQAMYGAKSVNTQAIKNLIDTFLTKHQSMKKSCVKFQKTPPVG